MNKIQYKNILVLDIDTKNIDKISRITEIAWYHTKIFIYDYRDNKIKHYVRE